jgi:hypothetical protein
VSACGFADRYHLLGGRLVYATVARSCGAHGGRVVREPLPRLPDQHSSSSAAVVGKPAVDLDQLRSRGLGGLSR